MRDADKMDINTFKIVNRAITESDNLEVMCAHLTQLLVGALGIKGCAIFARNPDLEELEIMASFGLSVNYLNKGPVSFNRSMGGATRGEPIVISDVSSSERLQYPEYAREEGIRAIVSLPAKFKGKVIGALRLYHSEAWAVSDQDLDSLQLLADNIALAMMYTRLQKALQTVKKTVNAVHSIWLASAQD